MKNFKKIIFILSAVLACTATFITATAAPAKTVMTEKSGSPNEMSSYAGQKNYASVIGTYIFDNGDGTITAADAENNEIIINIYDKNTFALKDTKTVPFELNKFGGLYSGEKYNFIVFGQNNPNEDNSVSTFKTVKYSKTWEKLGEADYKNNNTTVPFDAGSLRMAEYNGYLYIRSAHEMYTSSDGLNHQSNITYSVDINSMTVSDEFSKVWNIDGGYVSHSFNQFILIDNGQLVAVDHGDAYPRSIVLGKYRNNLSNGKFSGNYSHINLLEIPGNIGNNYTGVSVGGFEASADNYITAVNSVDFQSSDTNTRNILLLVTEKNISGAGNVKQIYLTNYDNGKTGSTPYLVKINENKFAVLWTEFENNTPKGVRYVYTDGDGNMLSDVEAFDNAVLSSECQPVVVDQNMILWFANTNDGRKFCVINTDGYDIGENVEISKPTEQPPVDNNTDINIETDEDTTDNGNITEDNNDNSDITQDDNDNSDITQDDNNKEDTLENTGDEEDTPDRNEAEKDKDDMSVPDEEKPITVWLDGEKLNFDVEPIIENGRTLVPMRVIFEALGAEVTWDDATRTAIAVRDDIEIRISIDQKQMRRNTGIIILDVPARLINSRTLVPVRAVSEGLDANVDWIDAEKKVIIETAAMSLPEEYETYLTNIYGQTRYMFEQYILPEAVSGENGFADDITNKNKACFEFINTAWNKALASEIMNIQMMPSENDENAYTKYLRIIKNAGLSADQIFDISYEVSEKGTAVMLLDFKKTDTLLACKYIGITPDKNGGVKYFTAETDVFSDITEVFFCEVNESSRANLGMIQNTKQAFLEAVDLSLGK